MKQIPKSIQNEPKYKFLFNYYFLEYFDNTYSSYKLSNKAYFWIRYNRKDTWRFAIPVIISILALIISIISILLQIS